MIPMGKNNNNKQDGNDWYKKKINQIMIYLNEKQVLD